METDGSYPSVPPALGKSSNGHDLCVEMEKERVEAPPVRGGLYNPWFTFRRKRENFVTTLNATVGSNRSEAIGNKT